MNSINQNDFLSTDDPTTSSIVGSNTSNMLACTVYKNAGGVALTKRFEKIDDQLKKFSAGRMSRGTATIAYFKNLHEFYLRRSKLLSSEALGYGLCLEHPHANIKTDLQRDKKSISRTNKFFKFERSPGIFMFDFDAPKNGKARTLEVLYRCLIEVVPELAGAPMLGVPSASSFIYGIDGRQYAGGLGFRLYIAVKDASLIPEAGRAIFLKLWAAGFGDIEVGSAGQALKRSIVDASVWQGERLDFAASPVLGVGLERREPPPIFYNEDAEFFDLSRIKLSAQAEVLAKKNQVEAIEAAQPRLSEQREIYIAENAPKLARRQNLTVEAAGRILRSASEKLVLTGDFVLIAQGGKRVTVQELLDDPASWEGKRFHDPLEPAYGDNDDRIAVALLPGKNRQ